MLSRQPLSQGAVLGHVLRRNVRSNWCAYYLAADGLADHFGADLGAYNIQNKEYFVFAAVLPPGYHQVLIYDPQLERAFCKDVVIKLNERDQYPEYPQQTGASITKVVPNVWLKYKDASNVSKDELHKAFEQETEGAYNPATHKGFKLAAYMKNEAEQESVMH